MRSAGAEVADELALSPCNAAPGRHPSIPWKIAAAGAASNRANLMLDEPPFTTKIRNQTAFMASNQLGTQATREGTHARVSTADTRPGRLLVAEPRAQRSRIELVESEALDFRFDEVFAMSG